MTTKNPRINVSFEETTAGVIAHLAHLEHKSVAGFVRELTLEALERREDFQLSKIAEKRNQNAKTYSHEQAWK